MTTTEQQPDTFFPDDTIDTLTDDDEPFDVRERRAAANSNNNGGTIATNAGDTFTFSNGDRDRSYDSRYTDGDYTDGTGPDQYTEITGKEYHNGDEDGSYTVELGNDDDTLAYTYANEGKAANMSDYRNGGYEVDPDGNVTRNMDDHVDGGGNGIGSNIDDDAFNVNDLPPGVTVRDQQEDAMMRLLAHQLNRDWDVKAGEAISPSLERRLRDFRFAQGKRRDRYGDERPWGILGLYDHLQGVRIDVEWAEDAAWRRDNDEPYLSWADFEDSRNSGFNRPWFTYFILVVCTGVLVASIGVNGWTIEPLSVNPMIGPSAETLVVMGAKQTSLIVNGGQWYRLFTPMFLHAGLIHYLLNMLALWFIGSAVEQSHGFVSAAIIFVISAVGGNILSAIFLPEYISVGASGGIFGLIGACIADIAINWNLLFSKQVNQTDRGTRLRHVKVLIWLVFDILINCLIGLTPFVDNFTHLGGMMYGFLCGLSTIERLPLDFFGTPRDSCARVRNYAVRFFGLILSVILIMISTAVLVESDGGTSPCSNCRYVSCVPFPFWASEEDRWWYCDDCDRVTADGNKDETTGYFEELVMTCPDGTIESIDLSGQNIKDKEWLRGQLPTFCRKNCDSLFA